MSETDENLTRVYTINLGRAWITPQHKRTDRVINIIKEFAKKHMKSEEIKIDQDLNRQIWKRGKTNPPRKVRVKMVKDDNGIVIVSSYEEAIKTAPTAGTESASLGDHEKEDLKGSNSANTSAD
ncbi:MAG TPA: 50S ribosomal protein L31e [Nitrososphaeraceae archaeon]|jgi:large subunit ribosomal protein L31e|nr:60S ribosomal protein L31 [Thermoproteota archaeon]HKG70521.1 50S ribosomal protein L31e [Nitrososphaeraceae archaeon]